VPVNILGPGNYFGEEEILNKSIRKTNAQPISAFAEVLYLSKRNFFLVGYGTDFFYQLKLNLTVKIQQREQVIKRHMELNGARRKR
jgi:CRP-like cAMP-binding protein